MGSRFASWRTLSSGDKYRLLVCVLGLGATHVALAALGYARTRRLVDRLTRRQDTRPASETDLEQARSLARLAAIAGHHGLVDATCLRQSLLLYGWLRRRGLNPSLQLGVNQHKAPFQAHAWVELEGKRLLKSDAGHDAFTQPPPRRRSGKG